MNRVRADLASRLRQRSRALTIRLAKPDAHLSLIRAALASLDPDRIAGLIVEQAIAWLGPSACAVYLGIGEDAVRLAASQGLTGALPAAGTESARWVVRHGMAFASADLRRDERVQGVAGAALALPLMGRARVIGALVVLERRAAATIPALSKPAAALLQAALEAPAVLLDDAVALGRAEALSVTDDLTQLYNSRYLNQVLRREAKRASRSGRPLSLLFLDLDGFKSVNDRHGHLAGSSALVEAAQVIRRSARETDVVARFGGDEFALILPDTGSGGAVAVAERVRERIAGHPFLQRDGLDLRLTVSIGVATLPDVAASAEELVHAADVAMYRIKDTGKNGVFIARGGGAN